MSRIAWWTFLAVLAATAIAACFGRVSPAPAANALAAGRDASALEEAQKLVASRPIPADHLLLLANAKLRAGDRAGFEQAFRLATTRGWRTEAVQLIAARSAIEQDDAAGAANRVAALWALGSMSPDLPDLTRDLLALSGGPEALGKQAGRSRVWGSAFLVRAGEYGTPDQIARLEGAASANRMED